MATYYVNSDLGKERVGSISKVGDRVQMSDGTWIKKTESGYSATKNGQSMDVQVGVSPSANSSSSSSTDNGNYSSDVTASESSSRSPLYPSAESVFGQQQETQTQKPSASEIAKNATNAVTEGLYTIGTELGMSYIDQLKNAGDTKLLSDGYTLRREADGSYSASKGGSSAKVYIDNDAVKRDTLLNEAIRGASGQSNPYMVGTAKGYELLQQAKDTGSSVWAPDNSEWSYDKETGGFYTNRNGVRTPITADKNAINREYAAQKQKEQSAQKEATSNVAPPEQASGAQYVIGSALGVLRADNMKPGDRMQTADDTWVFRNEDGSYTAKRNNQDYSVVIDREAAQRDPQWAILTAPPAEDTDDTGKKGKKSSKKSSGSSSSGGSGTYTFPAASTGTQKTPTTTATGTDRASLRKQAATAQKEMGDLARQISVAKIRGKDTSALQAKYNEAKARYDAANTQIQAPQQLSTSGARQEQFSQRQTLMELATQQAAERKDAWQSLPTVRDSERFSDIDNVTTGRTRSAEQQQIAGAVKELQKDAWRSLPTVRDSERFSVPSQTDALVQQAIAQAPRTLSGKPYLPENDGGFSHSSGSTERQNVLERIGNAALGGLIQSGGTSMDAAGAMYQAGQGGRNTTYNESRAWFQDQLDSELRTLNSMLLENRDNPGTYTQAEIKNQRRIVAEAQARVNAFALTRDAQEQSGELARDLAADVSNAGASRVAQSKRGASKLGSMALDALASAAQSGADMATNALLGTSGSMLPFAFRAFGGGTQQARNDGATLGQQLAYGGTMAAKEVFTEKMFNIAGLQSKAYGKGSFDDYVEKAVAGAVDKLASTDVGKRLLGGAAQFMTSAAGEGLEELIGDWMEWQLPRIYGKDPDSAKDVAVNSLYDFLVGAISGVMGNLTTPGQFTNYDVNEHLGGSQGQQVNRQLTQDELLDAAMQAANRGETLTGPVQAANQTTQQTTQGTAERGAEGVITGNEAPALDEAMRSTFTEALSGISSDVATNKPQNVKNLLNATKEQITRFIQNAFNKQNQFQYLKISDVSPELAETLRAAGINVDGYAHALRDNDIRHVESSHGSQSNDKYKVTADMLGDVQNVIDNYDVLYRGFDTRFGNPTVVYEKRMGNRTFYVEEVMADGVLGTKQMVVTGENSKPSFLKKYTEVASVSDDTDVPARSGSTGQSPPGNHVPDAPYNTSYNPTVPQSGNSVNQNVSSNDMGAMRSQFESVPKQAQTQSNTINSMETGWDVPEAQRTPIMYDTISEAKSLDNARLRLAQDYAGEMAELRGKHNWSGEEVDMGMTILDNYRRAAEQTGDWTEYSNWRKEVSAHGTAAGQALQAYAKYSRQTGGGIVADASAALERAAKKTNKAEVMNRVSALAQQYDAAVGTGQENAKVNVNDLVDIIKSASTARQTGTLIGNKTPPIVNWAMNRIANYARVEAQAGGGENLDFLRTFAADSIYNIAADTRAVSAGEQVKTVRRMGMLSKVSTVMRNLVSNNVFDPIDSIARNVSVPLDMLVSTITGTRSVAGDASWFSSAKRKGSMDGLARACMEVGLDVDTSGGAGKYENAANRTFKMSGGVFSKLMSTWEAYEGYTLNATDEFQKGGIEASVQQGIDRLYEKGRIKDDSLRDAGKQEALYRTFQDKTVLSDAAIGVRNALNKAHIGDIGAGDIMLPFAQVPSNLGARAIEYSPAGLGVAAADFINMIDSARKGEFTAAQQAKAVQGVGRALTGSGMIAIAAAGALRGWLKVTGDDDDKNKDALGKTHGLDGTQLNISAALRDLRGESAQWQAGDQLLSIGFLDPLNAQLTTGALIADDIRSEAGVTAGRVLGNSLSGALQSVLDTPVMSTFQDVATNYEYSGASTPGGKMMDAAQKYAANQLSSVIPNSLRGIAQGLDDTERNAYSSDNVWQQAVDNAKASIPGLRETLPAKTDVWGNPVKNEGGIRNFMNRNVNPGNVTTYKPDAVSSEIEKISEATNTSLYPDRTAPRSLKVDGEAISLTFEQRSMYQKAYGDAYSAAVTSLMNDKNYKAMPDSVKAEILQQAKDTATEQARDSLGIGYEVKSSAQKILEKSGTERNDALISAAVKAQHYLSPDTQKQLSDVDRQFGGADYVGLSDELFNSAKEKANTYFSAVEAAKYGGELSETQRELADKDSKELARYFMDKAIESRYTDTNKSGTKADEYLKAYRHGELNDAMALAVLSDKEVMAYNRFGRSAKVTPEMALQAANAHAGMKDVKDEDGKVTSSAQDQFDAWLDKQSWTDDQKSAVRMGFYSDSVKTYSYLADQLRKGNIKTADAKSELTTSYQAGWSKNVKDTGAKMADYIDAIVEYEDRPSEEERKAAGYKNTWTWFCDYLNTTDLTQEQKFGIAISMSDYSDKTKQKIWNRLR